MDIYETINKMRIERKRIEDIPMRVTYYARVSTMREEQDSSIEAQITYFTEMINKNANWEYVDGYVDRVRGESAENREQFKQMIDDGFAGKFDLVLTKEVSRFARNTIDSLTYTRELLKHGVGVFFLTDNICTIEQDSELRLTIMSSIAQDEVRKLSERIKFGHKKSIENGHVLGNSRIFGYDKINSRLIVNEHEAEMIRLIFETYATGEVGLKHIEDLLWDKGYRNLNGRKINHNTISGIITNPKYKGYYCGNKVKVVDYRTKAQKFLPPEEWIMYKDETGETVPQIVPEDLWEKANKILKERSEKVKACGRSAKKTSPLSGKIICGEHNEPFWRSSYSERIHKSNSIYQWICRTKKRGKSCDCPTIAIYENELYEILSKLIISLSNNLDDYTNELTKIYNDSVNNAGSSFEMKVKELEKEIASNERKKEKLLDLYSDDIITKSEFKERNTVLQANISELKKQLSSALKSCDAHDNISKSITEIKSIIKSLSEDKDKPEMIYNRDYINDVCDVLVDRIVVYAVDKQTMRIEIRLKLGASLETKYTKHIRSSGIMFKKMIPKHRMGNVYYIPNNRENIANLFDFKLTTRRQAIVNHPDRIIDYIIDIVI